MANSRRCRARAQSAGSAKHGVVHSKPLFPASQTTKPVSKTNNNPNDEVSISNQVQGPVDADSTQASVIKSVDAGELDSPTSVDQVITGFALILGQWCVQAAATLDDKCERKMNSFCSVRPPRISIKEYLKRLHRFFYCTDECFVLALVYIDRVAKRDPEVAVGPLSVHRLAFLAFMVAAKLHDDVSYSNRYYAKVGGLPLKEVNSMELDFLKLLDWKTFVERGQYDLYRGFVYQSADAVPLKTSVREEPEPEP